MLRWAHSYYPKKNVVKVDSDFLLNVDNTYGVVTETRYKKKSIHCHVFEKSIPRRDPYHKWYVPKSVYPHAKFPNYCNGAFYMMSARAVPALLKEAASTQFKIFEIEDIVFTGVLSQAAGITRVHNPHIYFWRPLNQDCINGKSPAIGFPMWQLTFQQALQELNNLPCRGSGEDIRIDWGGTGIVE